MQLTGLLSLLAAACVAVAPAAWSQTAPAPTAPNTTPAQPKTNCAPAIGPEAPTTGSGQSGSNLSEQLARSGGIICPPASRDSEMAVQPPEHGGRMPVIPPPGTPGGDQSMQPK